MQGDGIRPRQGDGQLQWNFGGWFGSVLGCSLWIVLAAAFVASHRAWGPAAVLAACAALVLGTGVMQWRRRRTLAPLPATLTLLTASFVAAVAALITLESVRAAVPEVTELSHWSELTGLPWAFVTFPLVMFGALAILMVVIDRRGRRA